MRDFFCLSVGNSRRRTFQRGMGNQTGESSVVSPILSCLPLRFLSAFSLRFSILRYERLFRVCNGLETRLNWVYQSKEPIYILLYFISFCRKLYDILETKNGIGESDEKSAGSMRHFCEKGAGMRDQHPLLPPPPAPPFQTPIGVISSEMAEMVQAQQITAVYTTVRWSILLIKVNKSWAWERSKIY